MSRIKIPLIGLLLFAIQAAAQGPSRFSWDQSKTHSNDFFLTYGWDSKSQSFASEISNEGRVLSDKRHLVATSRMIYGLAHSADLVPSYLSFANLQAKFLLEQMTEKDAKGPYFLSVVDAKGRSLSENNDAKLIVNAQAYGLNGLVALYETTKDPQLISKIEAMYDSFYERFHDPIGLGFFDVYDRTLQEPVLTKSYNSTVYVATSFLLDLAQLPTARRIEYVQTIEELADIVAAKFPDPSTGWIIENFTADWKPEWRGWQVQGDSTIGITGHNYQAAWFLMRATEFPEIPTAKKMVYLASARTILTAMLSSASLDSIRGGVFDAFKRELDEPMWNTNKAWWQQAEMILALAKADVIGLFQDHTLAQKMRRARSMATIFYFANFIDHENGGEFTTVEANGTPIPADNKGQAGTGSYHQVELARFMKEYEFLLRVRNFH